MADNKTKAKRKKLTVDDLDDLKAGAMAYETNNETSIESFMGKDSNNKTTGKDSRSASML